MPNGMTAPAPSIGPTDWRKVAAVIAGGSLFASIFTGFAASAVAVGSYRTRIDVVESKIDKHEQGGHASLNERIVRLEVDIAHLKQDMGEVKQDVKEIRRLLEQKR